MNKYIEVRHKGTEKVIKRLNLTLMPKKGRDFVVNALVVNDKERFYKKVVDSKIELETGDLI